MFQGMLGGFDKRPRANSAPSRLGQVQVALTAITEEDEEEEEEGSESESSLPSSKAECEASASLKKTDSKAESDPRCKRLFLFLQHKRGRDRERNAWVAKESICRFLLDFPYSHTASPSRSNCSPAQLLLAGNIGEPLIVAAASRDKPTCGALAPLLQLASPEPAGQPLETHLIAAAPLIEY